MILEIRQAKLYDVPAMARIERDSFAAPWSADEITKDVTAGGNVYVAVALADDERAGYAEIRMIAGEGHSVGIQAQGHRRGTAATLDRQG